MKDFVIEIDGEKAEAVLKKDQTRDPAHLHLLDVLADEIRRRPGTQGEGKLLGRA